MKNTINLFLIIASFAVIGLVFVGCDNNPSDNDNSTKFEGTWVRQSDSATIVFKNNTVNVANGTYVGTFTYTDTEITFTRQGNEIYFDYTLNSSTLVLTASSKNTGEGIAGAAQIQGTFTN